MIIVVDKSLSPKSPSLIKKKCRSKFPRKYKSWIRAQTDSINMALIMPISAEGLQTIYNYTPTQMSQ
jgi:hypothetical protein